MRLKLIIFAILMTLLIPTLAHAQGGQLTITAEVNLNVRAQPSTNSPSLQVVPAGTAMLAIGRTATSDWLQVQYKGVIGWVSAFYVSSAQFFSTLPVTDGTDPAVVPRPQERVSAPDGTLVNTGQLIVFSAFSEVNIRALPSETAAILGSMQPNERATVFQVDSSRTWGQVTFNGQSGWVALWVVNVLGDIRTVPVEGDPASGASVPIARSETLSFEQRELVDKVQAHLARFIGGAGSLVGIFNTALGNNFIACGPDVALFRSLLLTRYELSLLPELSSIRDIMNDGFAKLNDARAKWLNSCANRNTLSFRDQWAGWLTTAQEGAALLEQAQRDLALVGAR